MSSNTGYAAGNNAGLRYLYENDFDNYIISNPDIIVEKRQLEDFIAYMNSDNNYQMFGPTIEEHGKLNRGWKQKSIKYDIHDNYPIINRLYKNLIKYPASRYKGEITSVECLSGCFWNKKRSN